MNRDHLERLASDEWREALRGFVLPYTLGDLELAALGNDVLEVGPGPGLTTDLLHVAVPRLVTVELDGVLASALSHRLQGTGVDVVNTDATQMSFADARFTGAIMFTMLHHVPSNDLQDRLFAEVRRVLRPGGLFVASDGVATDDLEGLHDGDIYNPVEPDGLARRLDDIGFTDVDVRSNRYLWACHARAPMR